MSTEDLNRSNSTVSNREANLITNEHLIKLEELCSILDTDCFEGLTRKLAKQMLKSHGLNSYSKPKQQRRGSFRERIFNGKGKRDSWSKSDWNRVFNSHADDRYTVVRDGEKISVKRSEIVPGDLCLLEGWQIVPADMRIISSEGELLVDNRIITGNTRELKSISPTSTDFLLSQNVIFACTELLAGSCEALVLRTGDDTVFGELTQFAQKVKLVKNVKRQSSLDNQSSGSASGSTSSLGPEITQQSSIDEFDMERQRNSSILSPPPSPVSIHGN